MGQRIQVGKSLESAVTNKGMSVGDYRLEITQRDFVRNKKNRKF